MQTPLFLCLVVVAFAEYVDEPVRPGKGSPLPKSYPERPQQYVANDASSYGGQPQADAAGESSDEDDEEFDGLLFRTYLLLENDSPLSDAPKPKAAPKPVAGPPRPAPKPERQTRTLSRATPRLLLKMMLRLIHIDFGDQELLDLLAAVGK
ncbi:hypothetical protein Aduo_010689 [Ancylostoma duodenale]